MDAASSGEEIGGIKISISLFLAVMEKIRRGETSLAPTGFLHKTPRHSKLARDVIS